ncbi:Sodium/hydrogen exchanger family-domain-containing protein [Dactylonectria estremocensis]|uniref:Sodium/hydrogen exchanger family-domain-containing protein n=1 Tax=Dactylonectria estremocensis TaxID=1079267 RepID=A0A9P9J2Y5_9HYPO|nr:Sodium/hydrogen exchanger family-domain-containing protein [Dactylonectria estremocensis]
MESSLAYHEPSVVTISVLCGFLLLMNLVNYGLDKVAFCGLIGQVVLGMAWGTPGGKLLDRDMENAVMQLGYLGLILLVFEGGLATSFKTLKANLGLSTGVAITGISIPMGLSFILQSMVDATLVQAFAAGAALCSTSLGTTFTILGTSGLASTRLGVVLTSAAMMDDVVGLIMVQVVSNLGGDDFTAATVIRPVMVSLAFATVIPALCKFLVVPITLKLNATRELNPASKLATLLKLRQTAFTIHTALLLALTIGATFAGTSSLLAAYIAGAAISWWDSEVVHTRVELNASSESQETETSEVDEANNSAASTWNAPQVVPAINNDSSETQQDNSTSGMEVFDNYYRPVVEYLFKPFFFASIGFSIPITRMFSGPIVWRGVIYTILMVIGKLLCGAWLVPFGSPLQFVTQLARRFSIRDKRGLKSSTPGSQCTNLTPETNQDISYRPENAENQEDVPLERLVDGNSRPVSSEARNATPKPKKPKSLYPACIVGLGMVARGEIGFLIAALAESKGVFGRQSSGQPSELFLIITWAIALCTVIGPICVGLLVNRVRRLENGSRQDGVEGRQNVLGAWGVS